MYKMLTTNLASAKMKKTYTSSDSDTTSFTSVVSDPANGVITLSLTNTQTDAIPSGRYLYDVELSFTDSSNNQTYDKIYVDKSFPQEISFVLLPALQVENVYPCPITFLYFFCSL